MKSISVSIISLISLVPASAHARAASVEEDPVVKKRLIEIKYDYERLTQENREEYEKLKMKARMDLSPVVTKDAQITKFFTSLVAISDAQRIFDSDADLFFYQGICQAELHNVDAAIECYNKALKINPYHEPTIVNLIEINFFAGRYEEVINHIKDYKKWNKTRKVETLPLIDFKYLISLTKLSEKNPEKYQAEVMKFHKLYTYMDDTPYYYYANALKEFDSGNKEEGISWILQGIAVFNQIPQIIATWNKALIDADYVTAHQLMLVPISDKNEPKRR